jgi:hypothetical protein
MNIYVYKPEMTKTDTLRNEYFEIYRFSVTEAQEEEKGDGGG